MSTAIVFYSRSNNTKTGAVYIAGKLEAKLIELTETDRRKGLMGFIRSGYQAVSGKTTKLLGEPCKEASAYNFIYLMTPIWGGKITPAMNAFLEEADFLGKEVTVITFQADQKGAGSEDIYENIRQKVEGSGGFFLGGYAMHSAPPGRFAGKEYIEKQLEEKYFNLIQK